MHMQPPQVDGLSTVKLGIQLDFVRLVDPGYRVGINSTRDCIGRQSERRGRAEVDGFRSMGAQTASEASYRSPETCRRAGPLLTHF